MIDTHFQGPATNGYGAVEVVRGLQTKFGTTTAGAGARRLLLRTNGATATKPLEVDLYNITQTAFDGTAPDVLIISENLDGTGTTTERNIAAGTATAKKLYQQDKNIYVQYTLATGSPTAGEIWSFARVCGIGSVS